MVLVLAASVAVAQLSATLSAHTLPFGVSLKLPSKPEQFSKPGDPLDVYVSKSGSTVVVIGQRKMNLARDGSPDQQLAAAVIGSLRVNPGKLTRYVDVTIAGWPGLEYQIRREDTSHWIRNYYIDDSLLMIEIDYLTKAGAPKFAKELFDSVSLSSETKHGRPMTSTELLFQPLTVEGLPFSVDIPGTPKDSPVTMQTTSAPATVHRFRHIHDMRQFVFCYLEIPEAEVAKMTPDYAKKVRQDFSMLILASMNVTTDKPKFKKRGGLEWTITPFRVPPVESGRLEVAIAGKYIYSLLQGGPDPWVQSTGFNRFFDSFKLKN